MICWERLKAGGEGDNRGWDGWMALPTQWMWVWVNSGSWWWTGRPACCSPWGHKESDTTEWLNWTGHILHKIKYISEVIFASFSFLLLWLCCPTIFFSFFQYFSPIDTLVYLFFCHEGCYNSFYNFLLWINYF